MLELSSITVKSQRRLWLDDVSVKATPGRILGVVGPRGAGKTELARAIMGIIEPESGTVTLFIKVAEGKGQRAGSILRGN